MKMTKKKAGLGVAVIVAVVVLWSVLKPAPAEAVEITPYGSLNYMISNNENASGVSTSKAENNGSSIGVKLSDELSEGIEGFATIEVGIDADDNGSAPFDSKLAYAGVDMGDAGILSAGRQNSVFKGAVTSHTDVFSEYGNKAAQKLFSRDSHTVVYSNTIGALTFDNQVKIDGTTGKSGVDVYETAATFDMNEDVKLGAAYSDDKVNEVKYYGAGLTVAVSDVTSIGYNHTIKDNTVTNLETSANEVAVSHTIVDTTFSVGYGKIEDGNAYSTVGAKKKIGSNLELYGAFESTDVASGLDTSGMSAGIKFKF
jgi:predicted porin